jgi:hypothetical protein
MDPFRSPRRARLSGRAVSLAGSAMLTLALGSSISAARSYLYKRVLSNVVAMPLGTLLIWLTAPHLWLGALLLPVVILGDGRSADRTAAVAGAAAA